MTNMVDAAGTTAYSYTAGGSLQSEDGPWANDTVSYTYHATVHGLRTGLSIQQPAASFAVTNVYDAAKRLTNVALNSVRSGMLKENPEPQKSPKLKLRRSGMVRGRCPGSAPRWLQHGVRRRRRAGLQDSDTSGPHVAPTELYREGAGWHYNHAAPLELTRAGGIGGLLARSDQYNPGTGAWGRHVFYHADGNGNVTHTVDSSQTRAGEWRYDPYGRSLYSSTPVPNQMRFSSKLYHSNSGLYYYGYRFYDPNLQRWLNRDPIGEEEGSNLYRFVGNNPISSYDRDGLMAVPVIPPWILRKCKITASTGGPFFPITCRLTRVRDIYYDLEQVNLGGRLCEYICTGGGFLTDELRGRNPRTVQVRVGPGQRCPTREQVESNSDAQPSDPLRAFGQEW